MYLERSLLDEVARSPSSQLLSERHKKGDQASITSEPIAGCVTTDALQLSGEMV